MQKEENKRLITIPMQSKVFNDFSFDVTLPDPTPGPKYMFYPFEVNRFTKPKLTNLNFLERVPLHAPLDLGLGISNLINKPELYNADSTFKERLDKDEYVLDENDLVLFGDIE